MGKPASAVVNYGKVFVRRILDDEVFGMAAQLAYYFLLSLFPFLIFVFALLGFLGITTGQILQMVEPYIPEQAFSIIQTFVSNDMSLQHGGLLSFGIIATIWSASNAINAIFKVLNHAYDVQESRNFFIARGLAILLTFAMVIVIILALVLPVFGEVIGEFLFSHVTGISSSLLAPLWGLLRWLVSFAIIVVVFSVLYYIAPNKRFRFRESIVGAVIAAFVWEMISLGFSFYVGHFGSYQATYGSLGGIIVLMIWFYLTGLIMIIGGEINAVNHYFREQKQSLEDRSS